MDIIGDILLAMLKVTIIWFIGTAFAIIGICVFLAIYSTIRKISTDDLMNKDSFEIYSKYAFIIGAIFAAAVLAVQGGIL